MLRSRHSNVWLMNESLAFYAYTSTFRNPVFDRDLQALGDEDDDGPQFDRNSHVRGAKKGSNNKGNVLKEESSNGGSKLEKERPTSAFKRKIIDQAKESGQAHQNKSAKYDACRGVGKNKHEKLSNFCDNLIISIKGKAFVLELNFKRHLTGLKKFLDKRLAWIRPNKPHKYNNNAGSNYGFTNNSANTCDKSNGAERFNKQRAMARFASEEKFLFDDADDSRIFWQNIQPNSAKSLEAQQRRLLNRLERTKRDNQKLFNLERGRNFRKKFDQAIANATRTRQREDIGHYPSSRYDSIASSSSFTKRRSYSSTTTATCYNQYYQEAWPDLTQTRQGFTYWPENDYKTSNGLRASKGDSQDKQLRNHVAGSQTRSGSISGHGDPSEPENGPPSLRCTGNQVKGPSVAKATKTQPLPAATSIRAIGADTKRKSRWIPSGRQIKQAANHALVSLKPKQPCIVCYTNAPNIVTLPCEHDNVCSDCFIEIIYMAVKSGQFPLKCVLCRQKIERIRCSRRLLLSVIEKSRTK